MKKIFLTGIFTLLFSLNVIAETIVSTPDNSLRNDSSVLNKIDVLEDKLLELRRDQLNYSIEKNLLKEAYSSNLETINVVITIILGTFSIVGFLGIRTIGAIKEEFNEELRQFREVRSQSEARLKEIESQQENARERLDQITETNSHQDRRLKLLELIESTTEIIRKGNYNRALEYIAIGLEMDETNISLLQLKEYTLNKLQRYMDSMAVEESILAIDPENDSAGVNLCELSLLHGKIDRYNELRKKFSNYISKIEHLNWVFDACELYVSRKDGQLEEHIKALIQKLPDKKQKNIHWRFEEAIHIINKGETREITPLLLRAFNALQGSIEPSKVIAAVDTVEDTHGEEI